MATTLKALATHFKTTPEGVHQKLVERGWSGLEDFIADVGERQPGHYLVSKHVAETLSENGNDHKTTSYGKISKGNATWRKLVYESVRTRPTFLERIGASKDLEDTNHPLYKTWIAMLGRCYDETNKAYKHYQRRKPSEEWLTFKVFAKDMGERPEGTTLDRLDNDKGYSKENCRWATQKQQASNKISTVKINYKGQERRLEELANELGIKYSTLRGRVNQGWPEDQWASPSEEWLKLRQAFGVSKMVKSRGLGVTINGETKTIKQWVIDSGVCLDHYRAVVAQVKKGVPLEEELARHCERKQAK